MSVSYFPENCKTQLKALSKSAIFAMSRGGKELFHTNFLSFVLEIDPETLPEGDQEPVKQTQSELLKLLFGDEPPLKVMTWREKNSLDLIVLAAPEFESNGEINPVNHITLLSQKKVFGLLEGKKKNKSETKKPEIALACVVVEAKLKALPTKEQLLRYNGKLHAGVALEFPEPLDCSNRHWGRIDIALKKTKASTSTYADYWAMDVPLQAPESGKPPPNSPFAVATGKIRCVLLSPGDPGKVVDGTGWEYLSWTKLIECFDAPVETVGGGLMSQLLRDYGTSTSKLLEILEETRQAVVAFCDDQSKMTLGGLLSAVVHKDFQQRRIHDLVGKYAYNCLELELVKKLLKNIGADLEPESLQTLFKGYSTPPVGCLKFSTYTFMSNATPGMGFEFVWEQTHKKSKRRISVGIQIQGAEYRHFTSASHPNERLAGSLLSVANLLGKPMGNAQLQEWWCVDEGTKLETVIKETSKSNLHSDGFYAFDRESFVYTKGDAGNLTFSNLLELLTQSVGRARALLNKMPYGDNATYEEFWKKDQAVPNS